MRASSLVILLTATALVVIAAATAPTSPTQLPEVIGNKQGPVKKKPAPKGKGTNQPPRDMRPAKKKPGQRYYTGHRSVAFLTMGEIDVIRRFPEDMDCHGCCDINPTVTKEEGGRIPQESPASRDVNSGHESVKSGDGVNNDDAPGSGPNANIDRCLGCCDANETRIPPMPGVMIEGGTGGPDSGTVTKETGNQATKKNTQNQPPHRPRENVKPQRSYSLSSSEEGGAAEYIFRRRGGAPAGARTEVAERANIRNRPSQPWKKTSPCQRSGRPSRADFSSWSSSEES